MVSLICLHSRERSCQRKAISCGTLAPKLCAHWPGLPGWMQLFPLLADIHFSSYSVVGWYGGFTSPFLCIEMEWHSILSPEQWHKRLSVERAQMEGYNSFCSAACGLSACSSDISPPITRVWNEFTDWLTQQHIFIRLLLFLKLYFWSFFSLCCRKVAVTLFQWFEYLYCDAQDTMQAGKLFFNVSS